MICLELNCPIITQEPLGRFASNFDGWTQENNENILKGNLAQIIIYDQTRVNGGSNFGYPGQRWVSQLVYFYTWKSINEESSSSVSSARGVAASSQRYRFPQSRLSIVAIASKINVSPTCNKKLKTNQKKRMIQNRSNELDI